MRKLFKRGGALLLTAALVLSLMPAALASGALGTEVRVRTDAVAPGVTVTNQTLWSASGSDLRTENYITYEPNGIVTPVVSYGSYLTSRQTLTTMARSLEAQGLRVVGGINASFYENNGCPIGPVIHNGRILAANPDYGTVGFRADGSAVVGQPSISISAYWTTRDSFVEDEEGNEVFVPGSDRYIVISGFNKIRNAGGYYLVSGAYASTTKNTLDGVDVVLAPTQAADGLPLNGTVTCQVAQVRSSVADTSIPAGCFILSMNNLSDAGQLALLAELQEGDTVTLQVATAGAWADVTEAVGGLYELLVDGQVGSGLPSDGRAPRTAVGQRADGSLVLYTIDGRQSGYSIGGTYSEVAGRLRELGCVNAVVMDGGGSTSIGTTWPSSDAFQMINQSSDGTARSVSTCLFLCVPASYTTGELGSFSLSASSDLVLAGASVPVKASALDTAFRAMPWDGELTWTAQYGQVTADGAGGWVYTADSSGENRFDTITVSGDGVTGSMELMVVGRPTALKVTSQGSGAAVSTLSVQAGSAVQLSAAAEFYTKAVWDSGTPYTWTVSPQVGEINANGLFTAGQANASGEIVLRAGAASVTIPVSVQSYFVDIQGNWARTYIDRLYELGIAEGVTAADGRRYFYPTRTITRGELLTMIVRMLGEDTAQYAQVELPFADRDSIAGWALPYVRAAYALGLLEGTERGGARYADAATDITRQEAMTIIGRTLGYTQKADLSAFSDADQVSGWASSYVQTLVALGIVEGSGGRLTPTADITRAEIAKIVSEVAAL